MADEPNVPEKVFQPPVSHAPESEGNKAQESQTTPIPAASPALTSPTPAKTDVDNDKETIRWTSSEFQEHDKSFMWYLILAIATVLIAAVLYLVSKSIVTIVVVVICGLIIGVYGRRKPDQLEYSINRQGIRIGPKLYLYDEFRLCVLTPQAAVAEIMLIPTKRFLPPLAVRFQAANEEKIVSVLSEHLPIEERPLDLIDSLMRRIHF